MTAPRYLTVDGSWHRTGISDSLNGFALGLHELGLSPSFTTDFEDWLSRYKSCHEDRYSNLETVALLDRQGLELCLRLEEELPGCKVKYFSDGTCVSTLCPESALRQLCQMLNQDSVI